MKTNCCHSYRKVEIGFKRGLNSILSPFQVSSPAFRHYVRMEAGGTCLFREWRAFDDYLILSCFIA